MKLSRSLFLAFAGLGLFACSNEESVENQLPQGTGAVTIHITSPTLGRSVETGTNDAAVNVAGPVTITLTAVDGSNSITLTEEQLAAQSSVTFWNVTGPQKVTVSMNGGKDNYGTDAPTLFAGIAPNAIPAYGETTSFTLSTATGSPTGDEVYEEGAESGDKNKVYQLYKATVKLAIPVARLEVSGIQHVNAGHSSADCKYKTLTIAGVYLDNVMPIGTGVAYSNGAFSYATAAPVDYSFDGVHGTGDEAILKDEVTATNFLAANATWPEEAGKAYAYYFYGADNNLPIFKIYFDTSEAVDPDSPLPAPRYAMITSYKELDGTPISQFNPGTIYRITNAVLTDKNIIGDEGGNTMYGVEVTVEEAAWTVKTISADWAE